jgi:hypothetical protein
MPAFERMPIAATMNGNQIRNPDLNAVRASLSSVMIRMAPVHRPSFY